MRRILFLPGNCSYLNSFYLVDIMNLELLDKIESLEIEVEVEKRIATELQQDLDLADEIHFDELKSANRWNFWLVGIIVFMAIWIATTP